MTLALSLVLMAIVSSGASAQIYDNSASGLPATGEGGMAVANLSILLAALFAAGVGALIVKKEPTL